MKPLFMDIGRGAGALDRLGFEIDIFLSKFQ